MLCCVNTGTLAYKAESMVTLKQLPPNYKFQLNSSYSFSYLKWNSAILCHTLHEFYLFFSQLTVLVIESQKLATIQTVQHPYNFQKKQAPVF